MTTNVPKIFAAVVLAIALAVAAPAEASAHLFPNPVGGTACRALSFQPGTDWGAYDIVARSVSCTRARGVIRRALKYGRPIAWRIEHRSHPVGYNHGDYRLRRSGAVIVFAAG